MKKWLFALVLAASSLAHAAGPTKGQQFILCINEGATTAAQVEALKEQYLPLARMLGATAGGQVTVVPYVSISLFETDYGAGRCDFVFGKTIDALAKGIAAGGYHAVAKSDKPYVAGIIQAPSRAFGSARDLLGHDLLLPPEDAFTTQLVKAFLRAEGLKLVVKDPLDKFPTDDKTSVTLRFVRYQEAVSQTVKTGWYPAGAVNPTVLRAWERSGGKVLVKMPPQPGWSVLANRRISQEVRNAVLGELTKTNDAAKAVLAAVKLEAFVPASDTEFAAVLQYLATAARDGVAKQH